MSLSEGSWSRSSESGPDVKEVRRRLIDKGLIYFAFVVPLTLLASLSRVPTFGWHPVYFLHIVVSIIIILSATFRKRLSYKTRANTLLGILLVIGIVGLPVFGLVGGAFVTLVVFATLTALVYGLKAGLIACAIDIVVIIATAYAVTSNLINFSFDISKYAVSASAWILIAGAFLLFVPITIIALGVVYTYLIKSLGELKKSQGQLRSILVSSPDAIAVSDVDGLITHCNDQFARLFGFERTEDAVRVNTWSLIPPKSTAKAESMLVQVLADNPVRNRQLRLLHTNGSSFPAEISIGLLRDDNDCPKSLVSVVRDITERVRAEEEVRKLSEVIEQSPMYVLITDKDGNIEYVNPAFPRITGFSREDALGKNPRILKSDGMPASVYTDLWQTIKSGRTWKGELLNRKKNGDLFWESATISPFLNSEREITHFVAIKEDITEKKRLLEQESRSSRLEMAGTLAGQVAHDFNNLLAPVLAYPEFIRDSLPEGHEAVSYLKDIENAAIKIAEINQNLLTMGRRGYYDQVPFQINEVVSETVRELKRGNPNIDINVNLSPDLMLIKGGKAQFQRILNNLLLNAVDAVQANEEITIRTENYYSEYTSVMFERVPKGEYVKLTLSDTGCGIPQENLSKVLEPFFSTKTADKKRGSGLGLSVVDAVIKDHGGYLDISSEEGRGTSFYLYFPVCREVVTAEPTSTDTTGTERVLVVDDDELQRQVTSLILRSAGYTVHVVDSGEEALEYLRDHPQDLLILDMVMPHGIDGTETYRRALEMYPGQKAITVSGYSESDRVKLGKQLGIGAFVKKPLTKATLTSAVRRVLDQNVEVSQPQ